LHWLRRVKPDTDRLTFQAFGTLVDITVYPGGVHDLTRIESELSADLEVMHTSWHAWGPGSLGRTNQLLATGRGVQCAAVGAAADRATRRTSRRRTDGLFNPALGRLIAAWGFHQDEAGRPTARCRNDCRGCWRIHRG
jgi:FAD:protein FMN transferase